MNLQQKAKLWGANFNTGVTIGVGLVTIASFIGTAVWITANRSRDIDDVKSWEVAHENLHKDLRGRNETQAARFDERLKTLEDKQTTTEGDVKTLTYRTTATEQSVGSVVASIKELTSSVNLLSGDVRVVREIVTRQDNGQRSEVR